MPQNAFDCDVLVAGSGAGGLGTATACRALGLDVILVEKTHRYGGTTARSGGVLWIPGNSVNRAAGVEDNREAALAYIRHEAGDRFDAARVDAYLEHGPAMVDFFLQRTRVRFRPMVAFPDYHPDAPGAAIRGRSIQAQSILRDEFGPALRRWGQLAALAPPLPGATFMGLNVSREEMPKFYAAVRSPAAFAYVARELAAHGLDLAIHGKSLRAVNGAALVVRLALSFLEQGGRMWLTAPIRSLLMERGCVVGALIEREGQMVEVRARRGVVLAAGGFPHDLERRRALYPHHPDAEGHISIAPRSNTGDGLRLAEAVGAAITDAWPGPAAWTPASADLLRARVFPHFVDRGKPGVIMIDAHGRRFVNESDPYPDIGAVMTRLAEGGRPGVGYMIADRTALRRYGLGMVRPAPIPHGAWLRSGYLVRDMSVRGLALRLDIDPDVLEGTIDRFNAAASAGADADFGKGRGIYNRYQGDPRHEPNPCLAPLLRPPFYAVKLKPGDIGTFAGLRTDSRARVLGRDGEAIPGLYAAGNDQASVFGGGYPGGGATLGPAMTFAYIAALDFIRR